MSALTNWNSDANFWKVNGNYLAVKCFKELYDADKTKEKKESSDIMWAVAFFADDTDKNIYRNIPLEEKVEILYDNLGIRFLPDNYTAQIEMYQRLNLNQFERTMRAFLRKLEEREEFVASTPYELKNAELLDKILSNTKTLYDLYQKLQEDIEKNKNQAGGIARGGVAESPTERGQM